ncbi:leucyl/phenylalanyl-tRNA--protein transferase [Lysobacteraceae bacterium NML08-0793]|nr:leucyl/phenylalanyl-tRNA--protein transferase [Xanthomonadaceae bacterium NML08-0793]
MTRIIWLENMPVGNFPPVELALDEPNGLLCAGGDLSPARLLAAYRNGIFPWFSEGEPILWWSPNPRMVFLTEQFRLASRFRRSLRKSPWQVHSDTAFAEVVGLCASIPRAGQDGTWITDEIQTAYQHLHQLGHAHSIEVFEDELLVGGLYGVMIGRMFFAESMFSRQSGGSKVALAALARFLHQHACPLIDAQVENPHLLRLGGIRMRRTKFVATLAKYAALPGPSPRWRTLFQPHPASLLA